MKVLKTQALKPVEILQDAGYTFMPVCNSNKLIGMKDSDWAKVVSKIKELDAALNAATPQQQLINRCYMDGEETFWSACFTMTEIAGMPDYDRMEINSVKQFMHVVNSCICCPTIETEAHIMYMPEELMDIRDDSDFFELKNIGDVDYE